MSAIAGMIDWSGAPAGACVSKAVAALALHGRDGEGLWDGGDVALGWRQTVLHAEDRGDKQPLTGGGGRFRLVFDGRIDNRDELARALALPPERARGMSDGAYVLAAYENWGEDCARRLLGDFAFAVWDQEKRSLLLARDHIGTRPLVYHRGPWFFAFATSADALFTNPDIPRAIDPVSVTRQLILERQLPERTFFDGISRLPGGHTMTVTENSAQPRRYWRLEDTPDVRFARDDDYVDAFRKIFKEAVRCRLHTIHPIGSHLSSGWDSGSVTSIAAELLAREQQGLKAYTSVPVKGWTPKHPGRWHIHDEGPLAALVAARHANIQHVLIEGPGKWDFDAHDKYARMFGAPRWDINNAGWYDLLHRTARSQGVRVMLTGGAGNLTISYEGIDRLGGLVRELRFSDLAREWACLRAQGRSYKNIVSTTFSPLLPAAVWDLVLRIFGRRRIDTVARSMLALNPEAAEKAALRSQAEDGNKDSHRMRRRQRMARFSRGDRDFIHGHTLAAWDIDLRDPTTDRRVMEFCYAIPDDQFFLHGQTRRLLRRAMTGVLPQAILQEQKRGFQAADWYEAGAKAKTELLAEIDRLAQYDRAATLLNTQKMRALVAAWDSEKIAKDDLHADAYLQALAAITVGRFIRRVGGRNE